MTVNNRSGRISCQRGPARLYLSFFFPIILFFFSSSFIRVLLCSYDETRRRNLMWARPLSGCQDLSTRCGPRLQHQRGVCVTRWLWSERDKYECESLNRTKRATRARSRYTQAEASRRVREKKEQIETGARNWILFHRYRVWWSSRDKYLCHSKIPRASFSLLLCILRVYSTILPYPDRILQHGKCEYKKFKCTCRSLEIAGKQFSCDSDPRTVKKILQNFHLYCVIFRWI